MKEKWAHVKPNPLSPVDGWALILNQHFLIERESNSKKQKNIVHVGPGITHYIYPILLYRHRFFLYVMSPSPSDDFPIILSLWIIARSPIITT